MTKLVDQKWNEYIDNMFKDYQNEYKNVTPYAYVWAYSNEEKEELLRYLDSHKKDYTLIDIKGIEEIDNNIYKLYLERENW